MKPKEQPRIQGARGLARTKGTGAAKDSNSQSISKDGAAKDPRGLERGRTQEQPRIQGATGLARDKNLRNNQ